MHLHLSSRSDKITGPAPTSQTEPMPPNPRAAIHRQQHSHKHNINTYDTCLQNVYSASYRGYRVLEGKDWETSRKHWEKGGGGRVAGKHNQFPLHKYPA